MRVGLATDWYLPRLGGIERQVRGLADALGARGHEVRIVTTTPDAHDDSRVVRIATPRLPLAGVACSPRLVGAMRDALRGCDVVHAHVSVVSPAAYAAVIAARSLGVPAVVTVHSVPMASARVMAMLDLLAGWSRWRVRLAGVSEVVTGRLRRAMPRVPVEALPNGIDLDAWRARRTLGRDGERVRVVTAMRLHRKKRPLALLRAFADAVRATGVDASLAFYGDGPQRGRLADTVVRLRLEGRVTLEGRVSATTLRDTYAGASLFALPCRLEAFGVAALEARAAGLPVLAMAESGVTDFLAHGRDALLARDDGELAEHLATLLRDAALRERLAAGDTSLARHDWAVVAARHERCYAELLGAVAPAAGEGAAMAGSNPSERALSSR